MDYSPIWISLKTAGATILVVFFLGLAAPKAVAALRQEKLKILLDSLLTLPLVLPPTVGRFFSAVYFRHSQACRKIFYRIFQRSDRLFLGSYGTGGGSDLFSPDVPLCQRGPGTGG